MSKRIKKGLQELKNDFNENIITSKKFISQCKSSEELTKEVFDNTTFLDNLERDVDLIERIYYILNNITVPEYCPYCGKLKTFTGRFKDGYRPTCADKECQSKNYKKLHTGLNIQSLRDNEFNEWQNEIKSVDELNDKKILDHFYLSSGGIKRSVLDIISNPYLIEYLNNRYKDSDSYEETVRRLKLGIEGKPKCPKCGRPVVFIGKESKMFTEYCSLSCSNSASEVVQKKQESDRNKNNGVLGWNINTPEKIQKRLDSLTERYGTTNIYDVSVFRTKSIETNLKRYGVTNIMLTEDAKRRRYESLLKNPYFGSGISKIEREMYDELVKVFPTMVHQYRSEEYPFLCDFYWPDKDLYIEYQGSQYHHFHPFDKKNPNDIKELKRLHECASKCNEEKNQYDSIIRQWTERDVKRREFVKEKGINWLEFFPNKTVLEIIDIILDFVPERLKLNIDISELKREIEYYRDAKGDILTGPTKNKLIIQYQQDVFYRKEKDFLSYKMNWDWMYNNRQFYLQKEKISTLEMLRGCKITGKIFGYSHFSPLWIKWFNEKLGIKTLFDPCGGWGHRMLGCQNLEKYIYNDIDSEVCSNIKRMVDDFGISNVEIMNHDIRELDVEKLEKVDAWFTCPPYVEKETGRNLEHYSCGDYTVEDYDNLIKCLYNKWFESGSRYFGIVLRDDMFADFLKPVIDSGIEYEEVEIYHSRNSHLVNTKKKKNKEKLYIIYKY